MRTVFQKLLLLLAQVSDAKLAKLVENLLRQIQFLKVENEILRDRLPEHIIVTPKERRRLLRFGKPLGSAIKDLITIVSPATFFRWLREAKRGKPAGTPGRRKRLDIRKLIVTIAGATGWGYTRVLGEIKKLTKQKVSRQFVINVMKEHGFDPGPKRGEKTWNEFLLMHANSLWQCDFFSKKVFTLGGVREFFLIAFLHVGSRKVFVTPATDHPTAEWVKEQAEAFCRHLPSSGLQAKYVFHDRDAKLGSTFDNALEANSIEACRNQIRAPNMQAFVERWIQSVQVECLDHFMVLGQKHLDYLVSSYVSYYHEHRPHQGLDNVLLTNVAEPNDDVPRLKDLRCQQWLGGLLKSYHRKAA